jgi:hypothetical protein
MWTKLKIIFFVVCMLQGMALIDKPLASKASVEMLCQYEIKTTILISSTASQQDSFRERIIEGGLFVVILLALAFLTAPIISCIGCFIFFLLHLTDHYLCRTIQRSRCHPPTDIVI